VRTHLSMLRRDLLVKKWGPRSGSVSVVRASRTLRFLSCLFTAQGQHRSPKKKISIISWSQDWWSLPQTWILLPASSSPSKSREWSQTSQGNKQTSSLGSEVCAIGFHRKECCHTHCWVVVSDLCVTRRLWFEALFLFRFPKKQHIRSFFWRSASQGKSEKFVAKLFGTPALQWYFIVAVVGGDRSSWEINMIYIYPLNWEKMRIVL